MAAPTGPKAFLNKGVETTNTVEIGTDVEVENTWYGHIITKGSESIEVYEGFLGWLCYIFSSDTKVHLQFPNETHSTLVHVKDDDIRRLSAKPGHVAGGSSETMKEMAIRLLEREFG